MRKFLGTLALLAIVIGVIGFSRNWFSLEKSDQGKNTEVQLLINREKIRTDTRQAADIARELGENLERKIEQRRTE